MCKRGGSGGACGTGDVDETRSGETEVAGVKKVGAEAVRIIEALGVGARSLNDTCGTGEGEGDASGEELQSDGTGEADGDRDGER